MPATTRRNCHVFVIVTFLTISAQVTSAGQQRERSSVPDRYRWDLTQIYPADQAWRALHSSTASQASISACGSK